MSVSVTVPSFIKNFNIDTFENIWLKNEHNFNNLFKYMIFTYNAEKMPNDMKDVVSNIINKRFHDILNEVEYRDYDGPFFYIDEYMTIENCKEMFTETLNCIFYNNFITDFEFNRDEKFPDCIDFQEDNKDTWTRELAKDMKETFIGKIASFPYYEEGEDLGDYFETQEEIDEILFFFEKFDEIAKTMTDLYEYFYCSDFFNNIDREAKYRKMNAKYIIYNVASKAYWNPHCKIGQKIIMNRLSKDGLDHVID